MLSAQDMPDDGNMLSLRSGKVVCWNTSTKMQILLRNIFMCRISIISAADAIFDCGVVGRVLFDHATVAENLKTCGIFHEGRFREVNLSTSIF